MEWDRYFNIYTDTLPVAIVTLSLTFSYLVEKDSGVAGGPVSNKNTVANNLSRTFAENNTFYFEQHPKSNPCVFGSWLHLMHELVICWENFLKTTLVVNKDIYIITVIQRGSTNHTWNWGKGNMEDHCLTWLTTSEEKNKVYSNLLQSTSPS